MATSRERIPAPQAGWSRELACDLFPGIASPFAWTFFRDPAEAALRRVLTELGATALPAHALWQRAADGRVYVASTVLAEAGAATHGAAWLGLHRPAAPTGPLARLQAAGAIRRAHGRVTAVAAGVDAEHGRLAQWLAWVHDLPWTQADLLHVMEELEPRATGALHIYFTLRAGLAAAQAALRDHLDDAAPDDAARLHGALCAGTEGLPTVEAAHALIAAAHTQPADPGRRQALNRFGHRGPGEMRPDAARWREHTGLLDSLAALTPLRTPETIAAQRRAAEAEAEGKLRGRGRPFTEALRRARGLAGAADLAWDGLVMVMAVAQRWVQVAAAEALAAQLINRLEDVFFLELEELKQIATGEWHSGDADQVRAEVAGRRAALEAVTFAQAADRLTSVSPGQAQGPAYLGTPPAALPPPAAIWLAESTDPGCAPFWLGAGALVTAAADAWSPGLVAARALGLPAVGGGRAALAHARPGQRVTVDGAAARIALD